MFAQRLVEKLSRDRPVPQAAIVDRFCTASFPNLVLRHGGAMLRMSQVG
ncbi:hypothetical protein [Brasilonema octagenarum]|nr:hypothetical protein [Brasilonema octagenarum]